MQKNILKKIIKKSTLLKTKDRDGKKKKRISLTRYVACSQTKRFYRYISTARAYWWFHSTHTSPLSLQIFYAMKRIFLKYSGNLLICENIVNEHLDLAINLYKYHNVKVQPCLNPSCWGNTPSSPCLFESKLFFPLSEVYSTPNSRQWYSPNLTP
jgi:hypothetical protein